MTLTFSPKFAFDLLNYAVANGAERKRLFRIAKQVGYDDPYQNKRIDASAMAKIWHEAHCMTNDPFLAFHMSVEFAYSAKRTPSLIMQSCQTVKESFLLGIEYSDLIADVFSMDLTEDGTDVCLDFKPKADWCVVHQNVLRDSIGATLVSCLNSLQFCLGRFIAPSILEFQFPRPDTPGQFHEIFNSRIQFGSGVNRIGFPSDVSQLPISTYDNGLLKTLRQHGDDLKRAFARNNQMDVVSDTKRVILDRIALQQHVTVEDVADEQKLTSRSLQRRLNGVGKSFQNLLDEVRGQIADRYLLEGVHSIDEIGYLLGYTETTSFARAFKRWRGVSPRQFALVQNATDMQSTRS